MISMITLALCAALLVNAEFCKNPNLQTCEDCTANPPLDVVGEELCGWCASSNKCILTVPKGPGAGARPCNNTAPCEFTPCCKDKCVTGASDCDASCMTVIPSLAVSNPTYWKAASSPKSNPVCAAYYQRVLALAPCGDEKTKDDCIVTVYGQIKCGWCPGTSTCQVASAFGFPQSEMGGNPGCATLETLSAASNLALSLQLVVLAMISSVLM